MCSLPDDSKLQITIDNYYLLFGFYSQDIYSIRCAAAILNLWNNILTDTRKHIILTAIDFGHMRQRRLQLELIDARAQICKNQIKQTFSFACLFIMSRVSVIDARRAIRMLCAAAAHVSNELQNDSWQFSYQREFVTCDQSFHEVL